MGSDQLIFIIVPLTALSAWAARRKTGAFLARLYMLVVFSSAALTSLGVLQLDEETRIWMLRCGWLALVLDEVITWLKIKNRRSREIKDGANGN